MSGMIEDILILQADGVTLTYTIFFRENMGELTISGILCR
jgi:hypothetical protein